jgi:hypothetical protein
VRSIGSSARGVIGGEACPREVGQRTLKRTNGQKRIWVCEGLIGGEACPREVGQRTLKRTSGWERIVGVRGAD